MRHLALIGLVVLLSACAEVSTRNTQLDLTLIKYEKTLRWSSVEQTNQYRKEPIHFTSQQLAMFKKIKVTGYDVIQTSYRDDKVKQLQVIQLVEVRYVNEDTQVERKFSEQQIWEWDKDTNRWWLVSPFPKISLR
ncbi:MAG: hypothetical protein OEU74_03915 [Gammaproteobacteria bacterium]|nr:hypothetical protein [Gammaproteobacteria bacterium]